MRFPSIAASDHAIQGGSADAEHLGSESLVAACSVECLHGMVPLNFIQRDRPGIGRRELYGRVEKVAGEIAQVDVTALRHHAGIPKDIFEFSDVTRPRMATEMCLGPAGEAADRLLILAGETFQEMPLKQGEVFLSFSERRQMDVDHREAVK